MLRHPTASKLHTLRLPGMAQALDEQATQPDIGQLTFEERLGLLVDREITHREDRVLQRRRISPRPSDAGSACRPRRC